MYWLCTTYDQFIILFQSAWNVFEITVLSGCVLSLILYFIRLVISLQTMKRFREDRSVFHNFQTAAGIDEVRLVASVPPLTTLANRIQRNIYFFRSMDSASHSSCLR